MGDLTVVTFRNGPLWNFSYLLVCGETRRAAVIDPAWDAAAIVRALDVGGYALETVLLTHGHSDHANAVAAVAEFAGARVVAHEGEREALAAHYGGPVTSFAAQAEGIGAKEIIRRLVAETNEE